MAKLSYIGRRSSGVKMGAVVKKDILKRISKTTGPPKKTSAVKEPNLELVLSGKKLEDEGLDMICEALVLAISSDSIKLEELSIAENELTAKCLPLLSKVIRSSPDIKDIDISKNNIALCSDKDYWNWKCFLESFAKCRTLRKLDLSSNPLGDRAIELLVGVYTLEPPIQFPGQTRVEYHNGHDDISDEEIATEIEEEFGKFAVSKMMSKGSKDDVAGSSRSTSLTSNVSIVSTPFKASSLFSDNDSPLSRPPISPPSSNSGSPNVKGLRAIPYLVLYNTGITDLSALWLSFILPSHPKPWKLLSVQATMKEPVRAFLLERYHTNRDYKGIIWTPNDGITALGLRALTLAERIRGWEDGDEECFSASKVLRTTDAKRRGSETAASNIWLYDIYGAPNGNQALLQGIANPQPVYELTVSMDLSSEMDRARLKLQGTVLRENGPKSALLWKTTLRMLVVSRCFLFGYQGTLVINGIEANFHAWDAAPSLAFKHGRTYTLDSTAEHNEKTSQSAYSPLSLPPIYDDYELESVSKEHDFPPLPSGAPPNKRRFSTTKKEDTRSHSVKAPDSPCVSLALRKSQTLSNSLNAPKISLSTHISSKTRSSSVHASKQWEANCKHESETKVAGATQSKFKDSDTPQFQLPGKLPAHLWMRIICLAEDAYDLTSSEQQLSLFNFARSSTTIMMEREILGKLTSFQIRRVLESVKALAYEV